MPKRITTVQKREALYSEIETRLCTGEDGLTGEQAKEILGWTVEGEDENFGTDYFIKDTQDRKVRCNNNITNRPLYKTVMENQKQEILRQWVFNGEPIIIGETGLVLNGQHTLVALALLSEEEDHHDICIDKLIVLGVDESDETVNTMDTCKPRSLTDIMFRSDFFRDGTKKERKTMAKTCSYAINLLWERMGAKHAFAPRQTHTEAFGFLDKHPRLLQAVNHVVTENNDNSITQFLPLGYAAGMLYLMGSSNSDPEEYIKQPDETSLDFSNWAEAEEFWVLLANGDKALQPLKASLGKVIEDTGGSRHERVALVAKAWPQYLAKGKVGSLKLKYATEDGLRSLADHPSVGGIDLITFPQEA